MRIFAIELQANDKYLICTLNDNGDVQDTYLTGLTLDQAYEAQKAFLLVYKHGRNDKASEMAKVLMEEK